MIANWGGYEFHEHFLKKSILLLLPLTKLVILTKLTGLLSLRGIHAIFHFPVHYFVLTIEHYQVRINAANERRVKN